MRSNRPAGARRYLRPDAAFRQELADLTGTTVETDYRKFGNLLQPATVKQTVMGIQQVVTLESVEYDKVDPAVFEPPAPIKALVK